MNALVNIIFGEVAGEMFRLTSPYFKRYCEKYNIEHVKITERKFPNLHIYLEKFQIRDLLDSYDRILYVDVDVVIKDNAPNIFDIVPFEKIGAVYDGPQDGSNWEYVKEEVDNIKSSLGDIDWNEGFVNAGVLVFSKNHKVVFSNPEDVLKFKTLWYDQTLINYNIAKYKVELFRLDHRYNHMFICGEPEEDAYFRHFAGLDPVEHKMNCMRDFILKNK